MANPSYESFATTNTEVLLVTNTISIFSTDTATSSIDNATDTSTFSPDNAPDTASSSPDNAPDTATSRLEPTTAISSVTVTEAGGGATRLFSDMLFLRRFICKVFAILSLQLLVTASIVLLFTYVEVIRWVFRTYPDLISLIIFLSMILFMISTFTSCEDNFRETADCFEFADNMILYLCTICLSLILGLLCSLFDMHVVACSMVAIVCVVVALMLFTLQSNINITMINCLLFECGFSTILFALFFVFVVPFISDSVQVQIYTGSSLVVLFSMKPQFAKLSYINILQWWHIMISFFGVILYSAYLVMAIFLIINHCDISPEDYKYVAYLVYMNILNIIKITRIVIKMCFDNL